MGKNTPQRQKFIINNLKYEIDELDEEIGVIDIKDQDNEQTPKVSTADIMEAKGIE